MTIAAGAIIYTRKNLPCVGTGIALSAVELNEAISGPVAELIFDEKGKINISNLLAGLSDTEFRQTRIAEILSGPDGIENWRVGEALAETYLTDHRHCTFPWPGGRDERKRGSSLPGADLVGFGSDDGGALFAFGEVKTSSEEKYPPSVMHGPMGLKQQLEDLRDRSKTRDDLVRYLAHRASGQAWLSDFMAASKRYLKESPEIVLFGVMIRDVDPHEDDLRTRVDKLGEKCPDGTLVELFAIYLPKGSVSMLGATIAKEAKGGQ